MVVSRPVGFPGSLAAVYVAEYFAAGVNAVCEEQVKIVTETARRNQAAIVDEYKKWFQKVVR